MSLDIKICGLSTPDAVDAAAAGGASHAGFIFFERSPRHVTPDDAAPLAARAKAAGVEAVVFDRGGNKYHGRVAAVADGAREGGLAL